MRHRPFDRFHWRKNVPNKINRTQYLSNVPFGTYAYWKSDVTENRIGPIAKRRYSCKSPCTPAGENNSEIWGIPKRYYRIALRKCSITRIVFIFNTRVCILFILQFFRNEKTWYHARTTLFNCRERFVQTNSADKQRADVFFLVARHDFRSPNSTRIFSTRARGVYHPSGGSNERA